MWCAIISYSLDISHKLALKIPFPPPDQRVVEMARMLQYRPTISAMNVLCSAFSFVITAMRIVGEPFVKS